jgi:LCCL domain
VERIGRWITAVVVVSTVTLAGSAGSQGRSLAPEPAPAGADWTATARDLQGSIGQQFTFVCPAFGRLDEVWGTTIFTDDSTVCSAAVLSGLITDAQGGTVKIQLAPGQSSYTGSTANGVTSSSYTDWDRSYTLVSAQQGSGQSGVAMGGAGWTASATAFRGKNGTEYLVICPGGGRIGTIYGTNVYTDDSSICTAAVQVGLISTTNGGEVTIVIKPGQSSYTSSNVNGVISRSYPSWLGSFSFVGAKTVGGGGGGGSTTTTTSSSGASQPTATVDDHVTVNGQVFTGGTIPYNATVDVTLGGVTLTTPAGTANFTGNDQTESAFVLKKKTVLGKPVTLLALAKGNFSVCPKRKTASARGSTPSSTVVRELWGKGKGKFQTQGRYAAATVRGTHWLTEDRCDGTLVKVQSGTVQVLDLKTGKTVTVTAGHSFLAKP